MHTIRKAKGGVAVIAINGAVVGAAGVAGSVLTMSLLPFVGIMAAGGFSAVSGAVGGIILSNETNKIKNRRTIF